MSDGDRDVAINVVSPSLPSRLSPSSSSLSTDPTTPPSVTESSCVSEHNFPESDIPSDRTDYVTDNAFVSETKFASEHELDDTDKQVSTDDTVINSASDNDLLDLNVSSSEEYRTGSGAEETMGNQSGKKKGSDDDTPDESKTKCCELPKKKLRDRNSKISKSSRSEDVDFDDDEVYPFDTRARTSEQDDHDTVELEPFEIVETDDIKFIAGAGTSDVIRTASESKFKAIPEEACFDEEEELRLFEQAEETILKETVVSVDRVPESGTTTAASTFEFRHVKPKGKLKALREESQTVYENVDMGISFASDKPKPILTGETYATSHSGSGSSKSNSSTGSKSSSRKNSKEAIPKPARNNKKTPTDVSYINADVTANKVEKNEVKITETQTSPSAMILTQTMFSKPKNEKEKPQEQQRLSVGDQAQNTYENVNLCAIMTPTGIVIGHKKPDGPSVTGRVINPVAVETPKGGQLSASSSAASMHGSVPACDISVEPVVSTLPHTEPTYETLNSTSREEEAKNKEEQTPKCKPEIGVTSDKNEAIYSEPNKSKRALPEPPTEDNKNKTNDPNVLQVEGLEKSVPPPSPQGMEILEEEEEEVDDEEDDDDDIEQTDRKSSEIADFTENICKRLSQLLETMPQEEEQTDDNNKDNTERYRGIHIYEEIDDKFEKPVNRKEVNTEKEIITEKEVITESETPEMVSSMIRLDPQSGMHRNDSSNTLKRTSGDSNTYPMTEFLGSSDDDLPEYFDPRNDREFTTSTTKADKVPAAPKSEVRQKPSPRDDYVDMTVGLKAATTADQPVGRPRECLQGLNLSKTVSASDQSQMAELHDRTPTAEATQELSALPEFANADQESSLYHTYGRHSVTYTESDLDISEHRDDLSTDSMLADDEDEETMEILFTKTYTEPQEGGEVFLSCTVVNSAYKEESKKSDTWLSDDALQYFETNAAEVMSTAFMRARKEMKDIQVCIQNLRHQMEHFHGDCDDVSLPDMGMDSLSPDYMPRKAVTD